jgi:two-component system NtrC family sensor kinase
MRLARKLTIALLLGICAVLAVVAYDRVRREIALFESDIERDLRTMGKELEAAVTTLWDAVGKERALAFVEEVNDHKTHVTARWIWLDDRPEYAAGMPLAEEVLEPLRRGEQALSIDHQEAGVGFIRVYFPVEIEGRLLGAIELAESLEEEKAYLRTTITRVLLTTGVIALLSGVIAIALGYWLVGRPVSGLIEQARRIGSGDLTRRVELRQKDEIADLARELNNMCDRLAEANERVAAETTARLATMEQLRHADRLMTVGKLAAGIAHELGTPLNVIMARAGMIACGEAQGGAVPENGQIIVEQTERMARIIRQLLDFARPRSPKKARIDLSQLVKRTLSLLTPLAERHRVTLGFGESHSMFEAEADPDQVQQVLSNLLVNAVQAMKQGGKVSVAISRERLTPPAGQGSGEGEYLRVFVRDEGEGIPQENLKHLFEPFFTTKQVGEGTGLGLSVSCGIAREHGGWIDVESRLGQGSCFTLNLPGSNGLAGDGSSR